MMHQTSLAQQVRQQLDETVRIVTAALVIARDNGYTPPRVGGECPLCAPKWDSEAAISSKRGADHD